MKGLVFALSCAALLGLAFSNGNYLIGRGISDCTGAVAEINMMGYAKGGQDTSGIHLRLYSRAFIFSNRDGSHPIVYVSVDAAMISQLLKKEVMARLQALYGDLYTDENVLLSGTHTHSGAGAYHQYVLFEVTSKGFYEPSLTALADGIAKSILLAHVSIQPGDIYMSSGQLDESNINRSPAAYENNPQEERDRYEHNTDRDMTVLRMTDTQGNGIGMINWFAVHPTSMNNTNTLISSDNKGYASVLFESDMNDEAFPGEGPFVAAFGASNLGDVSPNTKGARCIDTGKPCDILTSTCGDGKVQKCIASGPGNNMFESTSIIAHNQYRKAKELYHTAGVKLTGPVDSRFRYVDMSKYEMMVDGKKIKTCKPAMGMSFAAGTTDGPGAFNFKQGMIEGNTFWNIVRNVIKKPSKELQACQAPKPVLLSTGEISFPYEWQPNIVDFHLLRIGQFVMVGVPGEFTTMAGRRAREAVVKTLKDDGYPEDTTAVIAGLANSYADYITTYEEYQVQRYEGASTIYGPYTLHAMMDIYNGMAEAMVKNETVKKGEAPPNLKDKQIALNFPVIYDGTPFGKKFGGVVTQPKANYQKGEVAQAIFWAGNPRNSNPLTTTFMAVEKLMNDYTWKVVYKDSNWETKFHWERTSTIKGQSHAYCTWEIPENQDHGIYRFVHMGHSKRAGSKKPDNGVYRFVHKGDSKRITGTIKPYKGYSSTFKVMKS